MRNTAYKYRIYPNAEQEAFFVRTFGCCRKVWNLMLSDKVEHYREHKEMLHNTPAQYKDAYPFLREADSRRAGSIPSRARIPDFRRKRRAASG